MIKFGVLYISVVIFFICIGHFYFELDIVVSIEKSLTSIGTLTAGFAALYAAITWKHELKYKKRYESIERLEESFREYSLENNKFFYFVLSKMREKHDVTSFLDLHSDDSDLTKKYVTYNICYQDAEYYLSKTEKELFTYKPEKLQRVFIRLLPTRVNKLTQTGNYEMDTEKILNFENEAHEILNKGLYEIRKLREK